MGLITGTGVGVVVPQPSVGNARYGLFAAANGPYDLPRHGDISGVTYEQEHCGQGFLWPGPQCPPPAQSKTFNPCDGFSTGLPFTIAATYQAGAIGHDEATFRQRVLTRLRDDSQRLVEMAFWGGRTAAPTVADVLSSQASAPTDVTPVVGTPVSLELGIGLLEEYLATYSYRSVFHARPIVSPFATERRLSLPDGKPGAPGTRYLTPMGNVWSFGRGYSGNLPITPFTAPAAGTAYIVATGPVTLHRDPEPMVNPPYRSMDRVANQIMMLAEQVWTANIDCIAGYVLVNLVGTT